MATEANLYLVRHGESLANIQGQVGGDLELSNLGREQSVTAGLLIANRLSDQQPTAIIHTGLLRTIQTAEIIRSAGSFDCPVIEMPDFRERNMGIYESLSFGEFLSANPNLQELYTQYGSSCVWFFEDERANVESINSMRKRIDRGYVDLRKLYIDQSIILVAHSGSIKMIRFLEQNQFDLDIREYLGSYVPKNGEVYERR